MIVSRAFDWLMEAKEDLKSAEILMKNGQFHHSCFHAQQAAEKAVKALLLAYHIAKIGYSILDLLEEAKNYVNVPDDLYEAAKILDQYYIPPRYPNAFDSGYPAQYYTKKQAEEAIMLARRVIDFAEDKIRSRASE